eukprot:m.96830 g.96830  ORF g.96830 m.96830 type:complete len:291 (-) comp10185_c0_seq1:1729-2601(-)
MNGCRPVALSPTMKKGESSSAGCKRTPRSRRRRRTHERRRPKERFNLMPNVALLFMPTLALSGWDADAKCTCHVARTLQVEDVISIETETAPPLEVSTTRKQPRSEERTVPSEPAVSVSNLPPALRKQLVDDWHFVSQERRLVPLPAKKHRAIDDILKAFVAETKKQGSEEGDFALEMAAGVESAFNAAIGSVLLYPFERLQFAELCTGHPDTPFSSLFGVEHLLRLLVTLPKQYSLEKVDKESRVARGYRMLIEFLSDRSALYLVEEYELAPPPYIRGNTQLGHGKPEA